MVKKMFLQKFEMEQDGIWVVFNPWKSLANHLRQIDPKCAVSGCPNTYNKILTRGKCGVPVCKEHQNSV